MADVRHAGKCRGATANNVGRRALGDEGHRGGAVVLALDFLRSRVRVIITVAVVGKGSAVAGGARCRALRPNTAEVVLDQGGR